jgi:hypothetical protein
LSYFPLKNQQNESLPQTEQKLRALRGLKKSNLPILTPLNGFAFGEGSGVSFAFGNSLSTTPDNVNGKSVSETKAQGGGFGGGVGYVDAADVGSAYGGGRGGGNVTSLEMNYGLNKGSYTYAVDGATANTTFNGVSSGGGFGSGVFGGLFVLDPDTTLEDALIATAEEAAKDDKGKGKDKDKDKVTAAVVQEAEALVAGFYGSFGNTTGGGGGGFGFTGLYANGDTATNGASMTPMATAFGKGNSGVNASASGFGFGGGSTNVGNMTASGGGFGGGDSDGAAGGTISAGSNTVDGDTAFNATGGGSADGGGAGFIGVGLQPGDVTNALESP